MISRRLLLAFAAAAVSIGAAAYLRDPPWAGDVSSGMRGWEEDPPGTRWRWTSGYGSFFVASDATAMSLPLRAAFPGRVDVDVFVDNQWLARIVLSDPDRWQRTRLFLPRRDVHRRFRRIDLRVSRVVQPYNLGVQVGELELERRDHSTNR
jgi:hypothetical protein